MIGYIYPNKTHSIMRSYKKLQAKLDACIETSTKDEKYEFMSSLLPNIKHYDILMAYQKVLGIKPSSKFMKEMLDDGHAFYFGVLQSPYTKSQVDAIGTTISLKENSDGSVELEIDHKSIAEFFTSADETAKTISQEPSILIKEYKKVKKQLHNCTQQLEHLRDSLQIREQLIESLEKEIEYLEKEKASLPREAKSKH